MYCESGDDFDNVNSGNDGAGKLVVEMLSMGTDCGNIEVAMVAAIVLLWCRH